MNENIFTKFIHSIFGSLFSEGKPSDPETMPEIDSNGNFDLTFLWSVLFFKKKPILKIYPIESLIKSYSLREPKSKRF